MELVHYKKECTKCKRPILVEVSLFGTNHNAGVSVICRECLEQPFDKEFVEQNPELAKELEEWME